MRIYPANLDEEQSHALLKSCVVPRPIAWVSTISELGVANLAPFSCYSFVATDPPMLSLSIARKRDGKKDTLLNMEFTKDFVVNVVSFDMASAINATAAEYPHEISEFGIAGVTAMESELVRAPRVAESPVQMECRVIDVIQLGKSQHSLVIGEVLLFHIQDHFYKNGEVDVLTLDPIARLRGEQFSSVREVIELPRNE